MSSCAGESAGCLLVLEPLTGAGWAKGSAVQHSRLRERFWAVTLVVVPVLQSVAIA